MAGWVARSDDNGQRATVLHQVTVTDDDADIAQLLASGQHQEAALAYFRRGRLREAQQIYERLWNFGAAAEMARARGDLPDQLRLLLEARELAAAAKVGAQLQAAAATEKARAAQIYEQRQMWPEAAVLKESLGELEAARALFVKGAQLLEAARLDEKLGRPRQAGQLYERFLHEQPLVAEAPRARLALARILTGFSKLDDAARQLQEALRALVPDGAPPRSEDRALVVEIRSELVRVLLRLSHHGAAAHALGPLTALAPETPSLESWSAHSSDGQQLLGGRYRLDELIGGGGMGRVYRGVDELAGRPVALKLVARAPTTTASSDDGYRRFLREAETVAALKHPNIVRLLHVDEALGLLVMELMTGGTLEERLEAHPDGLPLGAVQALALQLCSALEAAHARGVIHRDVKPSNIFLAGTGEAKLGDFGVAHLQALGATQTAGFIGTLAFMSPEQISGAPLTFAADLYGLGVTLFVALTGRLPFAGPDFVSAHLGEPPPAPSQVRASAAPFDAIVLKLLQKAPGDRFEDLAALRRALLDLRTALREVARTTPATSARDAAAPAEPARPAHERYVVTAPLSATATSELFYATDRVLGRPVVIERFAAGFFDTPAGARQLAWLRLVSQLGDPHVQRVLALDRQPDGSGQVVFEAVTGSAPAWPLTPANQAALDQSLAPLVAAGFAPRLSTVDALAEDEFGVTLLVAGLAHL